jgi:hypothetical protein
MAVIENKFKTKILKKKRKRYGYSKGREMFAFFGVKLNIMHE